jgi:hypothetical protein
LGRPLLEATIFEKERLRCNACQQIFTAEEPKAAGETKYDLTAVAMIALLKYGTGVPFKRLERLQGQVGMPLAAALVRRGLGEGALGVGLAQWELLAAAAQLLSAVWGELIRQAAARCAA